MTHRPVRPPITVGSGRCGPAKLSFNGRPATRPRLQSEKNDALVPTHFYCYRKRRGMDPVKMLHQQRLFRPKYEIYPLKSSRLTDLINNSKQLHKKKMRRSNFYFTLISCTLQKISKMCQDFLLADIPLNVRRIWVPFYLFCFHKLK